MACMIASRGWIRSSVLAMASVLLDGPRDATRRFADPPSADWSLARGPDVRSPRGPRRCIRPAARSFPRVWEGLVGAERPRPVRAGQDSRDLPRPRRAALHFR